MKNYIFEVNNMNSITGKIGKFDSLKCSNCGSNIMFIQIKGNNTGLYCKNYGKWQKWLSKNEKNLWNAPINKTMPDRIQELIDAIENKVTVEMLNDPKSKEDQIRKNAYCFALEQCKTSLENILADRDFNDKNN